MRDTFTIRVAVTPEGRQAIEGNGMLVIPMNDALFARFNDAGVNLKEAAHFIDEFVSAFTASMTQMEKEAGAPADLSERGESYSTMTKGMVGEVDFLATVIARGTTVAPELVEWSDLQGEVMQ